MQFIQNCNSFDVHVKLLACVGTSATLWSSEFKIMTTYAKVQLQLNNFILLLVVIKGSSVPSAPGPPRILKVIDKDVTLTWTKPDSDGGSEITGYLIAYTSPDERLTHHVTVAVTTTAELNEEFVRGRSYVFAVAAKNAVGSGDFSAVSEEVKIPNFNGNKYFPTLYYVGILS